LVITTIVVLSEAGSSRMRRSCEVEGSLSLLYFAFL
jgi:hypothetical protein